MSDLFEQGGTGNRIMDPLDLFGGQARAGKKRRKKERNAMEAAAREHRNAVINDQRATIHPWIERGNQVRERLQKKISSGELDPKAFSFDFKAAQKDPGYQFRVKRGGETTSRYTAGSKGADKALAEYNKNYAGNEYGNAYNRAKAVNETENNRKNLIRSGLEGGVAIGNQARTDMANYEGGYGASQGKASMRMAKAKGDNALQYAQQRNNSIASGFDMASTFMGGTGGGGTVTEDPGAAGGTFNLSSGYKGMTPEGEYNFNGWNR